MDFYFFPEDEESFKMKAKGNFVRTIVFDTDKNEIVHHFARKVGTIWKTSLKNEIETDNRIRKLPKGRYQIYSWVASSKSDFALPNFIKK